MKISRSSQKEPILVEIDSTDRNFSRTDRFLTTAEAKTQACGRGGRNMEFQVRKMRVFFASLVPVTCVTESSALSFPLTLDSDRLH